MTLLEKIKDLLNEETKEIVEKVDLSKSAEDIVENLENENIICFKVTEEFNEQHDQKIL